MIKFVIKLITLIYLDVKVIQKIVTVHKFAFSEYFSQIRVNLALTYN